MKIIHLFFFVSILSFFQGCNEMVNPGGYYFSNQGDDNNSGRSADSPWKTPEKLNELTLSPGDKIFFCRGDTFAAQILIRTSGTLENPIVIRDYGQGHKPVLKGSFLVEKIHKDTSEVFSFPSTNLVKNLYINNEIQIPARFPNTSFLRTDRKEEEMGLLYDKDLNRPDHFWKGAELVFRSTDWTYDWIQVDEYVDNTFRFDSMKIKYKVRKGYGYFVRDKQELLDTAGEYFFSTGSKKCLFIPGSEFSQDTDKVEAVISDQGILLTDSISHIQIRNLIFRQYHKSGILCKGNNRGVLVENCEFNLIEESGVRFVSKADKCIIQNNILKDIYGRGISLTNSKNCRIINNTVNRTGLIPGMGLYGVNGMIGILVEARDETMNRVLDIENFQSDSNYVALNRVDSSGYIGIRVDGQYNLTEKNIIKYSLLELCDGGGLYCFRHSKNSTFQNNFIYHSRGNNESTDKGHHLIALGLYIDGAKHCRVSENTLVGNVAGMVLNTGSEGHICLSNVYFGNKRNQFTLPTKNEIFDENHTIKNNTFCCTSPEQFCVIQMYRTRDMDFGTVDSNFYANPYTDKIIEHRWEVEDSLSLAEWQHISGHDKNSKFCLPTDTDDIIFKPELFTNETNNDSLIVLNKTYVNCENEPIDKLSLKPFTSAVLFKKMNISEESVVN
jgi:parallel beta-helix repeat protein